ncbi:MAG: hypothetical protein OHK0046_44300 [Anaerolineae bacterium]
MSDVTHESESRARVRQRSRYDRPRTYVSWVALILGLMLGIGGGLYWAWVLQPVEEVDTAPWQLDETGLNAYIVAIMLNYAYDGDLNRTIAQLTALRLPGDDPIQSVAEIACELASTGYINSNSGIRAVRSMMAFYQGQGRTGCADGLVPPDAQVPTAVVQVVLPTPTLIPPPSKTPTPPSTIEPTATTAPFNPTQPPQLAFEVLRTQSFCSPDNSGVIEVRVIDFEGQELPGQPVRVRWAGGSSTFFTGLKPERGRGFADFQMEAGLSYTVEMPGLSNPLSSPLEARDCFLENGDTSVTSFEVIFRGG